jgi:hypothetical protein
MQQMLNSAANECLSALKSHVILRVLKSSKKEEHPEKIGLREA